MTKILEISVIGQTMGRIRVAGSGSTNIDSIPEQERWLFQNPVALAMVRDGLKESAQGISHDLGSFAQFAEIDTED